MLSCSVGGVMGGDSFFTAKQVPVKKIVPPCMAHPVVVNLGRGFM